MRVKPIRVEVYKTICRSDGDGGAEVELSLTIHGGFKLQGYNLLAEDPVNVSHLGKRKCRKMRKSLQQLEEQLSSVLRAKRGEIEEMPLIPKKARGASEKNEKVCIDKYSLKIYFHGLPPAFVFSLKKDTQRWFPNHGLYLSDWMYTIPRFEKFRRILFN